MLRFTAALAAACLLTTPSAWAQAGKAAPADVTIHKDLEYARVGDKAMLLDLYVPKDVKNPPLVVWIHGGGWRGGSKDGCPLKFLTKDGYAVASIAYRLTDVAPYPAQIHDCKGAVRMLRAEAGKYGYSAERIGVGGGSAGGHLVALLGTSHGIKELEGDVGGRTDVSSKVDAVLNLYGPTDLTDLKPDDPFNQPEGLVYRLFGGTVQEKAELARLGSPAHLVTPDDAPLLTLHGDADKLVPVKHGKDLHARYRKLELPSELVVLEGAGHGGPQFTKPEILNKIRTFFDTNLRK